MVKAGHRVRRHETEFGNDTQCMDNMEIYIFTYRAPDLAHNVYSFMFYVIFILISQIGSEEESSLGQPYPALWVVKINFCQGGHHVGEFHTTVREVRN